MRIPHFRSSVVVLVAAFALLTAGCTSPVGGGGSASPSGTPVPRPSLDASFVDRIDGSTATIPMMTAALRLLRGTDDGLHFNTTDNAYQNLIDGSKDVIFVTAPSDDELAAAAKAGVKLEVIPVVKDALVFLANTANPVDGLTQQQVQGIYTGKVTNWKGVGGADSPIVAYQRPEDSGSQTLFEQLAMPGVKPMDAPSEIRPGGMDGLMDVISAYDNSAKAIGFSVFYYTQQMYVKDNVKLLAIDGVAPTRQTIADGTYAYPTYYYAVVRQDEAPDSMASQLIRWCLSPEGQRTFSAASYVPLSSADIVAPDDGYGYEGSTPENTTTSSGTGGPVGRRAAFMDDICGDSLGGCVQTTLNADHSITYGAVKVPGYPQAQAAATAWLASLPPADTDTGYWTDPGENTPNPVPAELQESAYVVNGLLVVTRAVMRSITGQAPATQDAADFRLSDGHRMQLSDFFYDGVNYIDFINRNLLNEDTNQWLVNCFADDMVSCGERAAPFTGLPNDTLDFAFADGVLEFRFPIGNPFLYSASYGFDNDSFIDLNLPYNLSPYGVIWQTTPVKLGKYTVNHIVSAYGGVDPHDAALNASLDAWARRQRNGNTAVVTADTAASGIVVTAQMAGTDDGSSDGWCDDCQSATFDWATGKQLPN